MKSKGRSDDVMNSLDMMELTVKVGAALAEAGFPSSYVSVFVNAPGKVRLQGLCKFPGINRPWSGLPLKVKGVESVETKLR